MDVKDFSRFTQGARLPRGGTDVPAFSPRAVDTDRLLHCCTAAGTGAGAGDEDEDEDEEKK
jgi:hypothetical protein